MESACGLRFESMLAQMKIIFTDGHGRRLCLTKTLLRGVKFESVMEGL